MRKKITYTVYREITLNEQIPENELYIIVFLGGTYLERTRGLYLESLLEDHIWKALFWSTISGKNWWIISGKLFGGSYLVPTVEYYIRIGPTL